MALQGASILSLTSTGMLRSIEQGNHDSAESRR